MVWQAGVGAKLSVKGALEFKDRDGKVIKTVQVDMAVPLEQLGMSVEEAQELTRQSQPSPATPLDS